MFGTVKTGIIESQRLRICALKCFRSLYIGYKTLTLSGSERKLGVVFQEKKIISQHILNRTQFLL